MSHINEKKEELNKEIKNNNKTSENNISSEEEEEESELETIKQNNIPIYKSLYPPIKESFIFDDNTAINNKILRLNQELPLLRYKNAISSKNMNVLKKVNEDNENNTSNNEEEEEEEEEELKMTDTFLNDLIKVPCPISKSKIIAIISNFIRKSKLIEKLENEYQSDKKADLNHLSILCTENLTYKELKKGEVLFKIGEIGNRFYFILKGFISILKLKENSVKMSYYEYFNYCIKLLKENEIYILEETIKKNNKKIPYDTIDNLTKINKLLFQKKLYENINRQVIINNNLLLRFFSINEQKLENFDLNINEIQILEQSKNNVEWKNYLIKKIKPSKDDLDYFDKYNRFVNSKSEIIVSCFCLEPFLYLGPGFFFGDSALEKGNIYTGGRRNATIRAETEVILGSLKGVDYVDIIEPKRRLEKLKEIAFLFNNFFFQEISIHLFEKNYFHLFSAREYSRGDILFSTGVHPQNLIFIKDGKISLEFKTSVFNVHKLIKYLYECIFNNQLFINLSSATQKQLLNKDTVRIIQKYINDPIFKKLRGFSQKFVDELNKDRKYNIAFLAENETIGLQEIFLGIPYIMKGCIVTKKVHSYEISIEHLQKIFNDEKQIIIPYIKSSINKIFSLIERLQNIKQHYINSFNFKYEKGFDIIRNDKLNIKNSSSAINLNNNINNNINKNYFLRTEKTETNFNNIRNDMINNNINKSNIYLSDNEYQQFNTIDNKNINYDLNSDIPFLNNSKIISVRGSSKSPLKSYFYFRPKSKKILIKLKKNQKSNISPSNNIHLINNKNKINKINKIKNKTKNNFNFSNKIKLPNIKINNKNNNTKTTSEKLKSLFDINIKNRKDLLIGDKYFSLEKLKNKFNEIDFHNYDNKEFIQVIQNTKYNNINNINNINNDTCNTNTNCNSSRKHYETKQEPILKGKQKFLNYHLSYVPLNNLYNNREEIINCNSMNINDSIENTNSSKFQAPFLSQYSTKEITKSNTFRNKINSRNYLTISDTNSNFGYNTKIYKSSSNNKESITNKSHNVLSYDNNRVKNLKQIENETYKGNIKEKIKNFYNEIKSKGYLSFISNAESNMYFMRKFNKKYISAIKRHKSYKNNSSQNIEGNQKKTLPEIKEYNQSNNINNNQ